MSQPSGSKVVGPCRYCGKRYMLTNFMRRKNPVRDASGRLLDDTHKIACHRKNGEPTRIPTGGES